MNIKSHRINNIEIVELIADHILLHHSDDALDIIGNIYYQGFDNIIIHQHNISEAFFDLKNKIAGDILQKFTNYRIRLIIVGDFTRYSSQSLRDFILESNNSKQVNFVPSIEEALRRFDIS